MARDRLLELLERAGRGAWSAPPARVRRHVLRRPVEPSLAPRPAGGAAPASRPVDIRSAPGATRARGDLHSWELDGATLTLMVLPPEDGGLWRLRGRLWSAPGERATVALLHGDHVLDSVEVGHGGHFRFEEPLPAGWELELHRPGGRVHRVGSVA